MKITIDQKRCIGAAVCTDVCKNVFTLDSHGKSEIREEYQGKTPYEGEVPNDLTCVKQAANYCPAEAISIEDPASSQAGTNGKPTWRRRFWIGSAIVAVAIGIVQYVLYWNDLVGVNSLLSTPFIILGGIGLGYMVGYVKNEVISEETLLMVSKIVYTVGFGTAVFGFLTWAIVAVSVGFFINTLFPFIRPVWWDQYSVLVTMPPAYAIGTYLGYRLGKRLGFRSRWLEPQEA